MLAENQSFTATLGEPFAQTPLLISGTATKWYASGLPEWASINPTTGAITGTPAFSGANLLSVTAIDSSGVSSTALVDLNVISWNKLEIFVDVRNRKILSKADTKYPLAKLALKRDDRLPFRVVFVDGTTSFSIPDSFAISVGIKKTYADTNYLAFSSSASGTLDLSDAKVQALFTQNPDSVSALFEVRWEDHTSSFRTATLPAAIQNSVIRGNNPPPPPEPPVELVLSWPTPADIYPDTALSATQLNATCNVPGALVYSRAIGDLLPEGTYAITVTFTPTNLATYLVATKTVQIKVNKHVPVITWATPAEIIAGTALSSTQLNATCNFVGTLTYTPAADTVLSNGTHTLTVNFTPTEPDYVTTATKSVSISVTTISYIGGDGGSSPATTSAQVKSISGPIKNLAAGSTYTLNITSGVRRISIAYPATFGALAMVRYREWNNYDVTDTFEPSVVSVTGSNGIATSYNVYTYIGGLAFDENATYDITI